ncbi:unnamed protein product [Polarella glacialis]|uniref:Uncharacterized protein n=1 Tax=Polarella glacialis TaxID=89957 RepID=A0A813IFH1_POLGL|nr:unnamed protein product [Polarella glacialis]
MRHCSASGGVVELTAVVLSATVDKPIGLCSAVLHYYPTTARQCGGRGDTACSEDRMRVTMPLRNNNQHHKNNSFNNINSSSDDNNNYNSRRIFRLRGGERKSKKGSTGSGEGGPSIQQQQQQ